MFSWECMLSIQLTPSWSQIYSGFPTNWEIQHCPRLNLHIKGKSDLLLDCVPTLHIIRHII